MKTVYLLEINDAVFVLMFTTGL